MKGFIAQILIVIVVFNLVSMFRESSMLSSSKQEPPNFQLLDLKNNPHSILPLATANNDTVKGKTVLYFFAPWCSICRVSIGNLQNLYERNDDVTIIAIALDFMDKEEVAKFAQKLQLSFPIVLGNEEVKQAYQVSAYPSYYVIDERNTISHRSMGYSTELGLYLRSR